MIEALSLGNYLLLVDYTGRLFRHGKATISAEMSAILERIGTNSERWWSRIEKLSQGRWGDSSPRPASACARWHAGWASITWPTWADAQRDDSIQGHDRADARRRGAHASGRPGCSRGPTIGTGRNPFGVP